MTQGPAVATGASRTARGVRRPLGVLLLTLSAVVVAGGVVGWVAHHRSAHPAVPDVAAYARSGAVRGPDRAYSAWFDGQFAGLARAAPWLAAAGQSVLDECQALPSGGEGAAGATSWSMSCQRSQAGYYVDAGGGGSRVNQLERTLAGLGWGGFVFTPGTAAAGGQPAVLQAGYVAAQTQAGPAGKVGLIISWLSPAQTRAVRDYVRFPVVGKTRYVDPVQVVPPDLSQIARATAARGGNLVVVELMAEYTRPGG
jgi:hypothetical protein